MIDKIKKMKLKDKNGLCTEYKAGYNHAIDDVLEFIEDNKDNIIYQNNKLINQLLNHKLAIKQCKKTIEMIMR
jgi:restriction endonuclease Mrr